MKKIHFLDSECDIQKNLKLCIQMYYYFIISIYLSFLQKIITLWEKFVNEKRLEDGDG